MDMLRRRAPSLFRKEENPFHILDAKPDCYFGRMARRKVGDSHNEFYPAYIDDLEIISTSKSQLMVLVRMLDRICQTVHPIGGNLNTFGHDIRNLLILAATEFEAQCRGVLNANGARARNTADYVKLLTPMRLSEYEIAFARFAWLAPERPFEGWHAANPTKSLPWYDAYNATKHDRERCFDVATLGHCFSAVAAIVVLLLGQFGIRILGYGVGASEQEREMAFRIVSRPVWSPRESYVTLHSEEDGWTRINFPFASFGQS